MQRHANELRQAIADFYAEPISVSSVERLCTKVERIAHRMAPRLRAVKGGR